MRARATWVLLLASATALAADAPQVTKAPRLKTFVEAAYPPDKKAAGVTAQVMLSIEIGADGRVGEVEVTKSAGPDFDAAAVAAVKQFVFEPAEVDGQPAPVKILYRYAFAIREEIVKTGPQVNFEGVVVERFTKRAMPGVRVTVKDLSRSTETDAAGRFQFVDLPLGVHKVELSSPKLITVATDEEIVAAKKKTVRYLVEERAEGVDEEVVVRAPRIKKESVETTIRTEEARRVPGTQGDTLKVVQNLPGVGRSSFGSGQLVVWGSAPQDTQVFVDGVPIAALYHVGGLRSTVNSDLVQSIELTPGGYGADYGGGLGGLVRVAARTLPAEGIHGYVAADLIDASAMVTAAVTPRLSLAVAGRYSYLDRLLPLVTSADFGDFVPIPRYDDYQAEAVLRLRRDETLTALFLASDDHLRRSIASADPAQVRSEVTDSSFKRVLLRYSRLMDDGSSLQVTPYFGRDGASSTTTFGASPTRLDSDTWLWGVRAGYRRRIARPATLSLGVDFSASRTSVFRRGSVNLPAREGDVTVFGQPPGDDVAVDSWTATIASAAPYAAIELTAGPVTITPGLRLAAFAIDGDHLTPPNPSAPGLGFSRLHFALDPRLTAAVRANKRLTFVASAGVYHQAPDPKDLSAVFGNPKLGLSSAIHFSGGGAYKLTGTLSLEVVGFFKYFGCPFDDWRFDCGDLVSRSKDPTPSLAGALTQDGVGRSYGGQLLLRQDLYKGFFGWITYTVSRSERRDHPGQEWRLFDYDQTHVLAVLLSYAIGKGFTAGVRFRFSTGFPRTPVVGSFYDARDDAYQPIFGGHNAVRIPGFYQLDARVEKAFDFRNWSLNVFLDVQNVTDRQNPEEIIYNFDYTQRKYISGLPTLAVLGLRLERL